MIKLEDFVSETLKQIINGVAAAQEHAASRGGLVNPRDTSFKSGEGIAKLYRAYDASLVEEIRFDVVVTTLESTGTEGGIGVFVGPIA